MKFRLIILILFIFQSFVLNANGEPTRSIQWQRIELETQLREKISEFLSLILKKDKFFVEVQISSSSPNFTLPNFEMPKTEQKKVVDGVKFTNEKSDKAKDNGDYILFDKIGILSPLFQSESKSEEGNKELQIKFYQYQQKIERDLIAKTDLFGLITDVDITLAFDTKMEDKQVDEVKKLIEKVVPKIGAITPKIEVFKMNFYEEPKKVADTSVAETKKKNIIEENLPYLTGPVGTIVATVLVCLTAFILLAGFKKHQKALQEASAAAMASGDDGDAESKKVSNATTDTVDPNYRPGSPQLIEAISSQKEGVEKLFLYLEKSNDQASNLIKKWINLDSSLSNAALLILSERMSIDELYKVFEKLNEEERESWIKISSSSDITPDLKKQADGYIAQQVMEDIMTVSATDDQELLNLLVELTPAKAATITREKPDLGAVFVNLMSSNFLAQMYLMLNSEEISEISMNGLKMSTDEIKEKTKELKTTLSEYVVQKYQNPFSRRVVEVIQGLDPIRQEKMIEALIEEKQAFIIKDVVKKVIPMSIINTLPGPVYKEIYKSINKDLRLDFIISLDESERFEFINKVTQEGTKGREVLEFEVNKIVEDELAVRRIQNKKEEISKNYIIEVRSIIARSSEIKLEVDELVNQWVSELSADGDSANNMQQEAA